MLSRIAARTATVVVGFLAAACLVALPPPEPASAAGPKSVCAEYDYVNTTVTPGNSVTVMFALNGVYVIDGVLNQNGSGGAAASLSSWLAQSTNGNYVIVGAQNQSSASQPAVGFMLEDWLC